MQGTPRERVIVVNHGSLTDQLSLWALLEPQLPSMQWAQPFSLPEFGGHEKWAHREAMGEERDLDLKLSLYWGLAQLCWRVHWGGQGP